MKTTNFPNGMTSQGMPVVGGGMPFTFGTYYYVNPNGNGGNGLSADSPFSTIAEAYAACVSNKDDVIVLSTNSAHAVTAMLDVSKNRVHFVGDQFGRAFGQRARITMGITTVATDIAVMKNTGVGNTFTGIKFDSSNTKDESLYAVAEGGEYAVYNSCEFYKSTDLDESLAAELLHNGDSTTYRNCTFGSNVGVIAGAIIRPCVLLTRETLTGKVSRDGLFDNCRFWRFAGNTANAFIWSTLATDVERCLEVRDCIFNVTAKSTAVPAVAIGGVSAFTSGEILLTGSTGENGCTAFATQTGIFSMLSDFAATGGSGVQSS